MTANDVKITNIDDTVIRSVGWAKESTLSRLLTEAGNQTGLLEKISGVKVTELRNLKKTDENLGKLGDKVIDVNEALDDSVKNRVKTDRELRDSVQDLRYSMSNYSRQISSMVTSSANPMRQLPSAIEGVTSGLAVLTRGSRIASASILALGAVAAKVVERFIEGAESYRGMMQSGIMFNGSVNQMIQSVRSAGVSIEDAGQILGEFSQAIQAVGEQKFFQNIENSSRLFARLGMTQTEGMRSMAELDEMRRLSGLAYMQSDEDRTRTNEELVTLMQSQATLTGISVRRQREESRRVQQSEKLRFLQAGMSREQLEAQEQARTRMVSMGMSADLIEATIIEGMTGVASRQSALARTTLGPEYERMIAAVQEGRYADIGTLQQRESIGRVATEFAQQQRGVAFAPSEAGRMMVTQVVGAREANVPIFQAGPGREADLARRREMSQRILRGEEVMDEATRGYFNTVNQTAVAMGRAEALVMRLADPVITGLMSSLSGLSTYINNMIGGAAGLSNTALYSGLLGAAGVGLAGAVGGSRLLQMFRGGAVPGAGVMTPLVPTAGATAPGVGAGVGAGAGAVARGLGMIGGLGRGLGVAGGALGLGAGAYQASTAQDFGSRMMGVGTTALSGAAMGAMFGVPGAIIGGAAGLGVGLLSNLFGGGGAAGGAAGTPAVTAGGSGEFGLNTTQMRTIAQEYWGPDGAIATALRQLIDINNQVERNTARVANNYS